MTDNLKSYADLLLNHTPVYLGGVDKWINDAQANQSYIVGLEAAGKPMSELVQSGTGIEDRVILEAQNRARTYDPETSTISYVRGDVTKQTAMPWRFVLTYIAMDDHEVLLKGGEMTAKARSLMIKDHIEAKYLEMYTDFADTVEGYAWATPAQATMGTAGQDPFSYHYYINEYANGLYPGFTDKVGIDPATNANWRPTTATYATGPTNGTPEWDGYLAIFEAMRQSKFAQLAWGSKYSSPANPDNERVIACSDLGIRQLEKAQMIVQDLKRREAKSSDDPFVGDLEIRGVPCHYYSGLDANPVYPTGTAGAPSTEDDTTNTNAGARYMGINTRFMKTVHNSNIYMRKMEMQKDAGQPWMKALPIHTACNRVCRSVRRQFVVYPTANIPTP